MASPRPSRPSAPATKLDALAGSHRHLHRPPKTTRPLQPRLFPIRHHLQPALQSQSPSTDPDRHSARSDQHRRPATVSVPATHHTHSLVSPISLQGAPIDQIKIAIRTISAFGPILVHHVPTGVGPGPVACNEELGASSTPGVNDTSYGDQTATAPASHAFLVRPRRQFQFPRQKHAHVHPQPGSARHVP